MTTVLNPNKPVAVNPLKLSQPFGAALAFLGLKGMMPLFHGSQGCTAFAKVLLVRHFRESIPLSTTAMTEVSTILGGQENIEQAILTLREKAKPEIIGLLTTGLTETRGDDMQGILKLIRKNNPTLADFPLVSVSTPDYKGAAQDGYAAAVKAIVATDFGEVEQTSYLSPVEQASCLSPVEQASCLSPVEQASCLSPQITILAGSALSPGDMDEIKEIVTAFGLKPVMVPDLSCSLDGHLEEDYQTVTPGGTSLNELRQLKHSVITLAIGESMREAAEVLKERFGTDYQIFPSIAGLDATDQFIWCLAQIGDGQDARATVPEKYQRQRQQLQDAILDTHFYFGGKRVLLALEPDLLYQTSELLASMGATIQAAVTTTKSPVLEHLPLEAVTIGDLEDLEDLGEGADLIITNSHGKSLAKRLNIPLYRMGYPIFDRLGNGQRCLVGYRGTMQFLFDVGNLLLDQEAEHH